ncbi:MAG TPA: nucleotidyltransferase family protein [Hyphomonadaceae bacterium]|jgi:molybdenum cofactor cytidylyltransferase|nr:nucleotidyltransferase family protein [Hyphomonadaceae bacterium]
MTAGPGISLSRTAVVLLASGLSRRYGRKDKMLEDLGGRPLIEHAASLISRMDALTRIAVCPADRKQIGERLIDRFVIAVNQKPKDGLGHSIAVGVKVALQFKPDAILIAMGDMAFIEPWMLRDLVGGLGNGGVDIVHSGGSEGARPPTAFGPACFEALSQLEGDEGARPLIQSGKLRIASIGAPAPLLIDIDTKEDIEIAREQFRIRERHRAAASQASAELEQQDAAPMSFGEDRQEARGFAGRRYL